jgi:tol-pal system protein YbgF
MRLVGSAVFLAIALGAAGCVTRADFERVRRDQQEMRALLADTQLAVDKVNRRLDALQSTVQEQGGGGNKTTLAQLERRVASLEARGAAPGDLLPPEGGVGAPLEMGAAVKGSPAAAIAWRREESRLASGDLNPTYRRALELYKQGQLDQAIEQFRLFLRSAGKSDLADNAQYWIGEAYYSQADYNRAIIELNEVLLKYPQGDQVPGALLALATAFANSGDPIDARLILQKLISAHPSSEEAEVGRKQLQALTE